MFRRFLKVVAVSAFALLAFGAATLGTVYGLKQRDTPEAIATARSIVGTLSKRWRFADISGDFQPVALKDMDAAAVQTAIGSFRPLGRLVRLRETAMQHYHLGFEGTEGVVRRARLGFVAEYENGEAQITITLVTSRGVAKVQHLNIKPLRMPTTNRRRSVA